jgi:cysteine desulfurase / selenocysteine lyase
MFPEAFRTYFPHTAEQIYLNHAAISPFSTQVVAALNRYIEQRHLTEIENYFSFQSVLQATRERLAALLQTSSERIAFTANTSSGLATLATGLSWQAGDRILLNALEFPSNVYPFENLRRLGVEIDYVQPRGHYLDLEDFAVALTSRTRLLSISQVQFLTGQRMPLQALGQLCKQNKTWLSVDGIQALGATGLLVEAWGVDFVSSGSHKWLMGPAGAGFIYVSESLQAQMQPAQAGWLSVNDEWNLLDYQLDFRADARCFETGTLNFIGIAGLHAALGVFAEAGLAQIESHILSLTTYLQQACQELGLNSITPENASERLGIFTLFLEPELAASLHATLTAARIETSLREGRYLRFSPHFYNTQAELERVVELLSTALKGEN